MTIPAGAKRTPFKVERSTKRRTGLGTVELSAWDIVAKSRAKVSWGSSSERRENGREKAKQTATFRCSTTAKIKAVRAGDRLVTRGSVFDIEGIVHFETRPAETEITATQELSR